MLADGFKKTFSRAISIFYGLGYMGNIVAPILLTSISIFWGWRNALLVLATIPATTGIVLILYLRGESVGDKSIITDRSSSLTKDLKSSLKNKTALAIIAAQSLAVGGVGQGVITTYTPLFLKNAMLLGSFETSIVYSIAMVGGIIGTIMMGRYADRIGYLKLAIPLTILSSLAVSLLTLYSSFQPELVPHLFALAFLSFPVFSLIQSFLISKSMPAEKDILVGLFLTLSSGFNSVWQILLGYLIDTYNSFRPAWLFMAILNLSALLFLLYAYKRSSR
jgi:predicted MFS family arabinose efflux permease